MPAATTAVHCLLRFLRPVIYDWLLCVVIYALSVLLQGQTWYISGTIGSTWARRHILDAGSLEDNHYSYTPLQAQHGLIVYYSITIPLYSSISTPLILVSRASRGEGAVEGRTRSTAVTDHPERWQRDATLRRVRVLVRGDAGGDVVAALAGGGRA